MPFLLFASLLWLVQGPKPLNSEFAQQIRATYLSAFPLSSASRDESARALLLLDPSDCQSCSERIAGTLETARRNASIRVCLLRSPTKPERRQLAFARIPVGCIWQHRPQTLITRTTLFDLSDSMHVRITWPTQ